MGAVNPTAGPTITPFGGSPFGQGGNTPASVPSGMPSGVLGGSDGVLSGVASLMPSGMPSSEPSNPPRGSETGGGQDMPSFPSSGTGSRPGSPDGVLLDTVFDKHSPGR